MESSLFDVYVYLYQLKENLLIIGSRLFSLALGELAISLYIGNSSYPIRFVEINQLTFIALSAVISM